MEAGYEEPFRVDTVTLDGRAELRLRGDLDMATAPDLARALAPVLEKGVASLVLDLSQLDFIDSTGLSQLVLALRHQRDRGGEVVLQSPSEKTLRVLQIVGFTSLFTITDGHVAS